jgi:hypothetical protein
VEVVVEVGEGVGGDFRPFSGRCQLSLERGGDLRTILRVRSVLRSRNFFGAPDGDFWAGQVSAQRYSRGTGVNYCPPQLIHANTAGCQQ